MHLLKGFVFLAADGSIWFDYQNFIVGEVVEVINKVADYPKASEYRCYCKLGKRTDACELFCFYNFNPNSKSFKYAGGIVARMREMFWFLP